MHTHHRSPRRQRNARRILFAQNWPAGYAVRRLRFEFLEDRRLLNGSSPVPHGLYPGEQFVSS